VIFGTTKLFLTKNFYNILMIFFVGFMTLPFPTSPVQISWITFGTVNIPATLIAFQLIRPNFMKEFRRDVLDYVITAGAVGSVSLALLFAAVYFVDNNVYEARSAVTLFIALFGILIFWHTHDIDLFYPPSWLKHWGVTLLGLVLAALTMLAPFLLPHFFDFIPPTPLIWVLIITVFFLTAVLLALGRRYRQLLNQLWLLLRP
jgi:magnesium-transporting ATPase (P-type)